MIAITRQVAPSIVDCELTHMERQPIDFVKATREHHDYCVALEELGLEVITLPHGSFADGVFVEDPAVIADELALINNMGAASRRAEAESLAQELAKYRELRWMKAPATLDGGDVLRIEKTFYMGVSRRTNEAGVSALRDTFAPLGYKVVTSKATGCLHFKSGCSFIGRNTILINSAWIPRAAFEGFSFIEVDPTEPFSGNALLIGDTVLYSSAFPKTLERMRKQGFKIKAVDNSELIKAESGVTCSSQILTRPVK